ncbi:MAG: hypothetical protein WDA22_01140 [Bacteroidota bacterium]
MPEPENIQTPDSTKQSPPEPHWSVVLEPYLKKMFDDEEGKKNKIHIKEVIEKYIQKLWSVRYKFIVTNIFGIVLVTIFIVRFSNPYYDASIVILPDYGAKSSGALGGLAALAGVSLGDGSSTADVYKSLLNSETVIEPVVNEKYYSTEFPDSINLYTFFNIKVSANIDTAFQQRKRFLDVFRKLQNIVTLFLDNKTRMITLSVRTGEPRISSSIANNLVKSLDSYVRTKRKSNATMQRIYIEKRVLQVNDSLFYAENLLKDFVLRNRVISQSPQLLLEQTRLNRQIQIYQTLVIELTRQLELARIDEIRDAPIINVQEWAGIPVLESGPRRMQTMLSASFVIFFCSLLFFLFNDLIGVYFIRIKNILYNRR